MIKGSPKKSSSFLERFFSRVDTQSSTILWVGILQIPVCLLLLYLAVVAFPPNFGVFWNLPVPKGQTVGLGPYLLNLFASIFAVFHTIAMMKKKRWAIVAAALPYLTIGGWRLFKTIRATLHEQFEWTQKTVADLLSTYVCR